MGDDFFAFVEEFDDDYDLTLSLTRAQLSEDTLELTLLLRGGMEGERLDTSWRLVCTGVREHELVLGDCSYPWEMNEDHVLLWPYTKPVASLYFNGRPADAATAVGSLCDTHRRVVGDWHRFGRWFNRGLQVGELLASGYGLLAEGPEPLILGYQDAIRSLGIPSSILTGTPKHWNGQHWEEETSVKVAVILGKTYVVAERVVFFKG